MAPETIRISRKSFRTDLQAALMKSTPWTLPLRPEPTNRLKRSLSRGLDKTLGLSLEELAREMVPRSITPLTHLGGHETGIHEFDLTPSSAPAGESEFGAALAHFQSVVSGLTLAEEPKDRVRVAVRQLGEERKFYAGTTNGILHDAIDALEKELKKWKLDDQNSAHLSVTPEGAVNEHGYLRLKLSSTKGKLTEGDYDKFISVLRTVDDRYGLESYAPNQGENKTQPFLSVRLWQKVWGEP